MEVLEPEAGYKFFSIKKGICIPFRYYTVTQIECNSLKNAITIRPDKVFKRENPSMWIDTYHVDPNQVAVDTSLPSTANTQVNNLDSEKGTPEMGSQTPDCEKP